VEVHADVDQVAPWSVVTATVPHAGGRYVGAVGGPRDRLSARQTAEDGLPDVAPSGGGSRVPRIHADRDSPA
jgi:hypothetical protein